MVARTRSTRRLQNTEKEGCFEDGQQCQGAISSPQAFGLTTYVRTYSSIAEVTGLKDPAIDGNYCVFLLNAVKGEYLISLAFQRTFAIRQPTHADMDKFVEEDIPRTTVSVIKYFHNSYYKCLCLCLIYMSR